MNPKPQSLVYLAYVIPNPAEVTTFYPQAVVKNTQTGAIVATVNLTQDPNDSLRYTGSFMSPADSTGNGYYLDVITIPYTDTGHSVPSTNYWAATAQYFVYQTPSNYGGGYMEFPTTKELRKMVREELRANKIKFPKQEKVEFPEIPVPEKVDLSPTNDSIAQVLTEMRSFRTFVESLPTFKETDLKPLASTVEKSNAGAVHRFEAANAQLKAITDLLPEHVSKEIRAAIAGVMRSFEERFKELVEKGIPVRSPVFQEDKQKPKARTLAEIQRDLATVKR